VRYLVVLASLLLMAVAGYFGYLPLDALRKPFAAAAKPPVPAAAARGRVVSADGCGRADAVVFTLTAASVGDAIEGKIGRVSACDSNDTERLSGSIDWGDGTSSALEPGDFNGKDEGLVLAPRHAYKMRGTFPLFARIRAQCYDHGQSTRTIVCGTGSVVVR
jgi:hypothetical protein